jgi:glucose/arabinose dehydrogenase
MRLLPALALALACATPAFADGPPIVPFEVPAEPGLSVETVATGLEHPWGLAFLPDGRMLVTERPGRLRIVQPDGRLGAPLVGVPKVAAVGQGGLLDVALDPGFARNGILYLSWADGTEKANATVVTRARLSGNLLVEAKEVLRNPVNKTGGAHFGSRILVLPGGALLVSVGDGGNPNIKLDGANIRNQAQNPRALFGKTVRVSADGRPLPANRGLAEPASGWSPLVFTMGHRNIQGLARDPKTGALWATEHGAQGGDELNLLSAGGNYGWPLVTYSLEYSGAKISDETSRPGMVSPVSVWTPSIAPSGLAVYRGTAIPGLDGAILAGGLTSSDLRIIRLKADGTPARQTRLVIDERVRDVRVGPDGFIYLLTDEDEGRILRVKPA